MGGFRKTPAEVAGFVALAGASAAAGERSLFGRHGECAPIASLDRKRHGMPVIRTPDAFAACLASKGLRFVRAVHGAGPGTTGCCGAPS